MEPADELQRELRRESDDWREGYLVRLYPDTRKGLELQAREAAILTRHGYLTQSSQLAHEGSLMVAYVLRSEADLYRPLEHPGIEAATDPDSLGGRFARPLAWLVAVVILLAATFLLYEALG